MFAYEDVAVDVVDDDDTILVVDSSLVAAEVADILSRFNCVLWSSIEFGPLQCCCSFFSFKSLFKWKKQHQIINNYGNLKEKKNGRKNNNN